MSDAAKDNVTFLPVWKKGSSVAEWLYECSMIARQHPGRFERMALVYEETLPNGNRKLRATYHGVNTLEAIGLLESGKLDLYVDTTRK